MPGLVISHGTRVNKATLFRFLVSPLKVSDRRADQGSLTKKVTAACQPGAKPRIGKRFGALLNVS